MTLYISSFELKHFFITDVNIHLKALFFRIYIEKNVYLQVWILSGHCLQDIILIYNNIQYHDYI